MIKQKGVPYFEKFEILMGHFDNIILWVVLYSSKKIHLISLTGKGRVKNYRTGKRNLADAIFKNRHLLSLHS